MRLLRAPDDGTPPRSGIVADVRRVLRWIAIVFGGLVGVIVLWLVFLLVTNPSPQTRDRWQLLDDMPDPRGEVAADVVDDRMIVAGGLRGLTTTSRAVSALADGVWTRGPALPEGRHHAAGAGLDGAFYLSGGAASVRDWTPLANLWRLRPGGGWELLSDMPDGRQGHDMVALDGKLYVIGGVGGADVLIYDPLRGWTRGAPIAVARDHLRAVAWESEIWALAGRVDGAPQTRVDVYDPADDTWRPGPSLPEPMSAMAVGVLGDELHVVGGEDPGLFGGVIDDHVVLREGSNAWTPGEPAPLHVHGAGGAVMDERLIVAGGAARQGGFSVLSWTRVTQAFGPR